MKRNILILICIVTCIIGLLWYCHTLMQRPISWKSYIPVNTTKKYLRISSGMYSWSISLLSKWLENIGEIHIQIDKDSISEIDLSALKKCPHLKKIELYTIYKNNTTVIRKKPLTITWLKYLENINKLSIHDFPISHFNINNLPPHLTLLSVYNTRVENIITGDVMFKIPSVYLNISWPQGWYSYGKNNITL